MECMKKDEMENVWAQSLLFLNSTEISSNSHDLKPNSIVVQTGHRNPRHDQPVLEGGHGLRRGIRRTARDPRSSGVRRIHGSGRKTGQLLHFPS